MRLFLFSAARNETDRLSAGAFVFGRLQRDECLKLEDVQ